MGFDLASYVAGVASTIVGSWIASKIRIYHDNRITHLGDLRQKLFVPLRSGLHGYYGQLVGHQTPVVRAEWGSESGSLDGKVTEVVERMGWLLRASDPHDQVENAVDKALLQDARENHYSDLISSWEQFRDKWTEHKLRCESWVSDIAQRLVTQSGLVAFAAGLQEGYVLHIRLATFVYMRLFRFPTYALKVAPEGPHHFGLMGDRGAIAIGTEEQMRKLLDVVQNCVDQQRKRATELQRESAQLQADLQALSDRLSLAIASHRLAGMCPLVRFF